MDLSQLDHIFREDYKQGTLSLENVYKNPFEQFKLWFDDIVKLKQKQPNAMVLSTVSEQGVPESRVVLLKHVSEKGFCFFSNYQSSKGRSIDCNPVVALLFYNIDLERQIHVHGSIEKLSYEESNSYFQSRPFGSQVSAVASQQSVEVPSRSYLENQVKDILKQNPNGHFKNINSTT